MKEDWLGICSISSFQYTPFIERVDELAERLLVPLMYPGDRIPGGWIISIYLAKVSSRGKHALEKIIKCAKKLFQMGFQAKVHNLDKVCVVNMGKNPKHLLEN